MQVRGGNPDHPLSVEGYHMKMPSCPFIHTPRPSKAHDPTFTMALTDLKEMITQPATIQQGIKEPFKLLYYDFLWLG